MVFSFLLVFNCGFFHPAFGSRMFLIGEDAPSFNGLVITVNNCERKTFKGGLGVQGQKDSIELDVTLVNTGKLPIQVEPANDFELELDSAYSPTSIPGKNCLEKPFPLHPGTQSHASLVFLISTKDNKTSPLLHVRRGSDPLVISCDKQMVDLLDKTLNGRADMEEASKVAQFLLDSDRYNEAEKVVYSLLQKSPDNPVFLMQMAGIERHKGNDAAALDLLTRAATQPGMAKDEAITLAKKAFEQGQLDVAKKVLEPLAEKGVLSDKEILLLGRTWYFDNQVERAEKLLIELQERGFSDRSLFFTLGNIADKRSDLPNAIKWWEKTLTVDPGYYEAAFNIGVAYFKQGDKLKATEYWRRVVAMEPDAETKKLAQEALESVNK